MPWDSDDGKPAYLATDGRPSFMSQVADGVEASTLAMALDDAARALKLADDAAASRAELRIAVQYLAHAVGAAANVAELRGERLTDTSD
ncbi:hypothetical protein ACFWQ1_26605 [Streptomyces albidoflavus]